MSIASKLTKLETDITNAYDAVQIKGGTIPSDKNTNNLSTAINSISGGGGKPEQSKTATPSTSSQTILPDTGYTLSSVTVNAVTSSIDNNIQAENIKQGINILGVEGTFKDQANEIVDRSFTTLNITTDTIGSYSLRESTNLVTINAPNLTKVLGYACYGCTNLKNINTNADIVSVASSCFGSCRNLEDFDFELSNINTASFANCEKITKIICSSNISQLATNSVFSGCSSLKTLVLRKTGSVVTLRNVNSFDNTPFRNGEGGTVYVPNDLISSYESATNWSSLESTTFKAIEGSEYE